MLQTVFIVEDILVIKIRNKGQHYKGKLSSSESRFKQDQKAGRTELSASMTPLDRTQLDRVPGSLCSLLGLEKQGLGHQRSMKEG